MALQKAALFSAIKEYENNKWKVIGQKVGKPAKACEQYAKEHFPGKSSWEVVLCLGEKLTDSRVDLFPTQKSR